MKQLNALIEHIFDWRTCASRREFLKIFLAVAAAGLLLFLPYVYISADYIGLVISYGEDAARLLFDDKLTDGLLLAIYVWSLAALAYSLAGLFISVFSSIRRLNDLGASRWWVALSFVPVLNLFLLAVLLIAPSKTERA